MAALDELTAVLEQNNRSNDAALRRAEVIRKERAEGMAYKDIFSHEDRPLIVERVAQNMTRLSNAGSRLRRAQAHALRDEGMTMEAIAALFGVTRQRISELLRDRD